jgi:hypothetical protein
MRRAVSPTSTDTRAVAAPARGRSSDEREAGADVGGDVGAHGHEAELPERHLPRPSGEHGQRQGDHPNMQICDMRKEWPTPMTKGSRAATKQGQTPAPLRPTPLAQRVAGGAEGGRTHGPRRSLPHPGPLLQRGGPHEQRPQEEEEEDELDGGRSRRGIGDVPLQQVEDHADPDRRR